ncbi:hypothetical protein BDZ85DRAFT_297542 [Elsinoe ampelina]|uniref:Uncharacterized protein n=1 Tax=Elsinoe ampelina TaxID=302913 RepID=A0A6A6G7B1_9PEZI|nr:hypothetical protein BDZ85DRAFT_297542 [Elsinoe ampelina]
MKRAWPDLVSTECDETVASPKRLRVDGVSATALELDGTNRAEPYTVKMEAPAEAVIHDLSRGPAARFYRHPQRSSAARDLPKQAESDAEQVQGTSCSTGASKNVSQAIYKNILELEERIKIGERGLGSLVAQLSDIQAAIEKRVAALRRLKLELRAERTRKSELEYEPTLTGIDA